MIFKFWSVFIGFHGGVHPVHKVKFSCRCFSPLRKGRFTQDCTWTKVTFTLSSRAFSITEL